MNPFFSFDDDEFFGDLLLMGAAGGGKSVEATATGNPLTFQTDLARPLKSLLIPFTPVQSGSGDPSPQNIRSILPWNGLSVFGGRKNLLNPVAENMIPFEDTSYNSYTLANGQIITTGNSLVGFLVEVKEQTRYSYSFASESNAVLEVFSYSAKPNKIRNADQQIAYAQTTKKASFVTPNGCKYVVCAIVSTVSANVISDFQLEVSSSATAYEPYHPITDTDIVFPSPVYGGEHEAVSGKLMDKFVKRLLDDSDAWTEGDSFFSYSGHDMADRKTGESYGFYCTAFPAAQKSTGTAYIRWGDTTAYNLLIAKNGSSLTLAELKELSASGDLAICYELATPTEQTLTGHQITALKGENTIWSDADGRMTAVYLKKG